MGALEEICVVIAVYFLPVLKGHDAPEHVRGSESLRVCLCSTEPPNRDARHEASHSPPSSDLWTPYLKLEEIVLDLLLTQAQLGSHQLLQGVGHVPGHAHVPADIEVALLLVEHAERLIGQLPPQDVLNIDLKPEERMGPGPGCRGRRVPSGLLATGRR